MILSPFCFIYLREGYGKIARYGTLKTWANQMGLTDAVALLDATLQEEVATDKKLSQVATANVNQKAA